MVVDVVQVVFLRPNKDVTARKAQEPIAVATFREVEGHRPLRAWPGFGGYLEDEGGASG